MPKILFIQPTQYDENHNLCKQKRIYLPGLVFPLLAAMTPENWEVEIKLEVVDHIDYNADVDIVGIGTMGYTIFRALEIAEEYRKRGVLVVLGGYMASLVADEAEKHVDSILLGDAELSYPELLRDYENTGTLKKRYERKITELKNLPLPRYEMLTEKPIGSMLPVQAARGCPHSCSFCSIACLYKGTYLPRPVPEVLRDVKRVKELGFREFYLIDDNIIGNPAYFKKLCEAIKSEKMKWSTQCSLLLAKRPDLIEAARSAGAQMMSFGVESITQEGLNKLNKGWLKVTDHIESIRIIAEAGILVSTEMIIGTDSDTVETVAATYDFIMKARIPIPRFYILTPMPGSPLFKEYEETGRLITRDFRMYDGCRAVFTPAKMRADELTEAYWTLNRRVFSLKSILLRTLFTPYFRTNPGKYLFAFLINLHYRRYIYKGVPPNIF